MRVETLAAAVLEDMRESRAQQIERTFISTENNIINLDAEIANWLRDNPMQTEACLMVEMVDLIRNYSRTVVDLYTAESEIIQLDLLLRNFPPPKLTFAAPNATLHLHEKMQFRRNCQYAFVVKDLNLVNEFISSKMYDLLRSCVSFLGVRKAKRFSSWMKILANRPWFFLRTLNIRGIMTDRNMEELVKYAPNVMCLKIDSSISLRMKFLAKMGKLASLSVAGSVHMSENYAHNQQYWLCRPWVIKELEFANCSALNSQAFIFLSGLDKLTLLHLYQNVKIPFIPFSDLLARNVKTLTTLSLSHTNITTNRLLHTLQSAAVRLFVLRANYPRKTRGFTDQAMIRFLRCEQNVNLRVLELCGHSQLTEAILDTRVVCRETLEQLDLRDTGCVRQGEAEIHKQLIVQLFNFATEQHLSKLKWLLRKTSSDSHQRQHETTTKAAVLHIHLTYSKQLVDELDCISRSSGDKPRRVVIRFWKSFKPSRMVVLSSGFDTASISTASEHESSSSELPPTILPAITVPRPGYAPPESSMVIGAPQQAEEDMSVKPTSSTSCSLNVSGGMVTSSAVTTISLPTVIVFPPHNVSAASNPPPTIVSNSLAGGGTSAWPAVTPGSRMGDSTSKFDQAEQQDVEMVPVDEEDFEGDFQFDTAAEGPGSGLSESSDDVSIHFDEHSVSPDGSICDRDLVISRISRYAFPDTPVEPVLFKVPGIPIGHQIRGRSCADLSADTISQTPRSQSAENQERLGSAYYAMDEEQPTDKEKSRKRSKPQASDKLLMKQQMGLEAEQSEIIKIEKLDAQLPQTSEATGTSHVEASVEVRDLGAGTINRYAAGVLQEEKASLEAGSAGSPSTLLKHLDIDVEKSPLQSPADPDPSLASPAAKCAKSEGDKQESSAGTPEGATETAGAAVGGEPTIETPVDVAYDALPRNQLGRIFFERFYPVEMFTAPAIVTDYYACNIRAACTHSTPDPEGINWDLECARALCD
jgi:hypothetical protein